MCECCGCEDTESESGRKCGQQRKCAAREERSRFLNACTRTNTQTCTCRFLQVACKHKELMSANARTRNGLASGSFPERRQSDAFNVYAHVQYDSTTNVVSWVVLRGFIPQT
mmetsp:Transcript_2783/g.7664  ORF Transcript_2783/g.7664 Transcript_2783/m.7664 type:complete len:112 (-) Transcript_2783:1825-2160(-)